MYTGVHCQYRSEYLSMYYCNISPRTCYLLAAPKGDHACTRVIARVFTLGPAATAVSWRAAPKSAVP